MNILQLHRTGVYPPTNGGEKRVWKTAQALSKHATVSLATPTDRVYSSSGIESVHIDTLALSNKTARIYLWNLSFLAETQIYQKFVCKRVLSSLQDIKKDFDLVVCESPQMFLPAQRIASSHDANIMLNKHNAYFRLLEGYISKTEAIGIFSPRIVSNLRKFEKYCVSNSDITIFQSEADMDFFTDCLPERYGTIPNGTDFHKINNGSFDKGRQILQIEKSDFVCLFIGSYDYEPNKQAAEVIQNQLAPNLPDVKFLLVGRDPPMAKWDNVYCPGFVENYADVLAAADIALCPLTLGSGTKLKILDYLSAGLPIVTTPVGVQGLPINESNSLIKERPEDFVDPIKQLRDNKSLRNELAKKSEKLGENYSWETLLADYNKYIDSIS